MKILAVADIHGDKNLVRKLAEKADREKVDIVIICGDLTFFEHDLEGIIGPFKEKNKKVVLIPGNHETIATTDFLAKLYSPKTYNLHGYSILVDSVGLFGCGSGNVGMFTLDDDDIRKVLDKAHQGIEKAKKKVMITHMPPFDTELDNIGFDNVGSRGIRDAIEKIQPDFCLCGHIHETMNKKDNIGKTKVINVGREGAIITL